MSKCRSALFALAILLAGTQLADAASLGLSRASGPPTTAVTVTGSRFTANHLIDVYFDATDTCVMVASGAGVFTCTLQIPADARPQLHWITAADRGTGAAVQKSFDVRTDWTQFHGTTAAHTGNNPNENIITRANVGNLDVLWESTYSGSRIYQPVLVAHYLYFMQTDGYFKRIDTRTGAVQSIGLSPLDGFVSPSQGAVVANGAVYVVTSNPTLTINAFNPATGALLAGYPKHIASASFVHTPVTYVAKTNGLYVVDDNTVLWGINATTGANLPNYPRTLVPSTTRIFYGAPTLIGDYLYFADELGNIWSSNIFTALDYDPTHPGPVWSLGYQTSATIAAVAGHGVVQTSNPAASNNFVGIFMPGGQPVGTNTVPGPTAGSPAVAGGRIVSSLVRQDTFGASGAGSTRLRDAAPLWSTVGRQCSNTAAGSPTIANGIAFVADACILYAYDIATGDILWQARAANSAVAPYGQILAPIISDGVVYNFSDKVTAYSLNGIAPSARLPGGAMGVKPALSALKPDRSLPVGQPQFVAAPEE